MQDRERDSDHVYYGSYKKTPNKTCSHNPGILPISRWSMNKCAHNITETESSQGETSISDSQCHENYEDSIQSVFTKGIGSSNTLISIVQNDYSQPSLRSSGKESVLEGIVNIIDDVLNTKSDHRFKVTLELDRSKQRKKNDSSIETVYDKLNPHYSNNNYVYYNTGVAEKKHKTPSSCRYKNVCYHSVEMNVLQLTGFNQHSQPPVELYLSPMAYAERSILSECNIRKQSKRKHNKFNCCSPEVKSLAINNLEKLVQFIIMKVEEQNNCTSKRVSKNDVVTTLNNLQCRYQQTDRKIANLKKSVPDKLRRDSNKNCSTKDEKGCDCLNNNFQCNRSTTKDSNCKQIINDDVIVTNVLSHLEEIESHFVSVKHLINKAVTKGIVDNISSLPIKKLKLKKIPQIKSLPSRYGSHYRRKIKSKLISVNKRHRHSKGNVRNIPQESSYQLNTLQNSDSKLRLSFTTSLANYEKNNDTNLQDESVYSSDDNTELVSESGMSGNTTTTIENHVCKLSVDSPKPESSNEGTIDNRLKHRRIYKMKSWFNSKRYKIKPYDKQTCEKCLRHKDKQSNENNFGYSQTDLVRSKNEEPVEDNTSKLSTSFLDIKNGKLKPVPLRNGFTKTPRSPDRKNVVDNLTKSTEIDKFHKLQFIRANESNSVENRTPLLSDSTRSLDSSKIQYIVGSAYENTRPKDEEIESSIGEDTIADVRKSQFASHDELFATVLGLDSLSVLTEKENVIVERLQAAIEKLEDMQLIVGIKAALASIYGINQQLQNNTNNSINSNVGIRILPGNDENSNVTSIPTMHPPETQIISAQINEDTVKKDHVVHHQTNEEITAKPNQEECNVKKNDTSHRKPNEAITRKQTKKEPKVKKCQIVNDCNQAKEKRKAKTAHIGNQKTNEEIIPNHIKGEHKVKRDANVNDISIREIFGNDANQIPKTPKDHIVHHMTNENTIRKETKKEDNIKSDPKHCISKDNLNSDKKENNIEKYASLRPKLTDLQDGNETESDESVATTCSTTALDMRDVSCGASFISEPSKSVTCFEQAYCLASVSTEKPIPTKTNSLMESSTQVHTMDESQGSSLSLMMMKPHMKKTWARITANLETIVPMSSITPNKVRLPLGLDMPNGSFPNFKDLDRLWRSKQMKKSDFKPNTNENIKQFKQNRKHICTVM